MERVNCPYVSKKSYHEILLHICLHPIGDCDRLTTYSHKQGNIASRLLVILKPAIKITKYFLDIRILYMDGHVHFEV